MAALLKLPFNSPNHTEINKKEEANLLNFLFFVSGYQDSNLGPPAPKAGALTGLRYTRIFIKDIVCGADGTRTRDPMRDRHVF